MNDEVQPAIDRLVRRIEEMERKANGLKQAVNVLCEEGGLPPRYPDGGGGGGDPVTKPAACQISDHTFYGKRQQTATREYLEMRKTPAKPREIYDALKQGGFDFEGKDEDSSLAALREMLRKRSNFFHKLPTGSYGLTNWYEHIKQSKPQHKPDDEKTSEKKSAQAAASDKPETAATKKAAAAAS